MRPNIDCLGVIDRRRKRREGKDVGGTFLGWQGTQRHRIYHTGSPCQEGRVNRRILMTRSLRNSVSRWWLTSFSTPQLVFFINLSMIYLFSLEAISITVKNLS
jgi:hypothetical protein